MDEKGMSSVATLERLSAIPWCRDLLESREWIRTRTSSRVPKSSTEDSFFAETLGTQRNIRSCTALRPAGEERCTMEGIYYEELRVIYELGDGVNGWPKIAHGGFLVTVLDESMGMLLQINSEARLLNRVRTSEASSPFTAYLNTSYKKPVPTPTTVLCTVKIVRRERNKIHLRATIEDGVGTVFTEGEAMFVVVKSSL